ncbi:carbohydrate porin [Microbulbifer sp. YPW1]|uniref:carbohydrate porin n=1 Tax=Microbulbifer sp. YPW1 TaxID=2745199 RepID=UPI0015996198|nr:carbohydrate porin [Microbulbifer sp. YPW1]QKX18176.1 carbohydrate porin [Microbulbifer sp. YPW1]
MRIGVTVIFLTFGNLPGVASADTPQHRLCARDRLTCDWNGSRSALEAHGVNIDFSVTGYYQGLLSGGVDNVDFEFGGRADGFITLNTEKLSLWHGGGFNFHLESRFGELADRPVPSSGGIWPVNAGITTPLGDPGRLVGSSIYYSHRFGDNTSMMLGKINAFDLLAKDPFFGGWARDRFNNVAFVAPPSGVVPPVIMGTIISHRFNPWSLTFMVFDPNDRTNDYGFANLFNVGTNISLGTTWTGKLAGRSSSLGVTGTYSTKDGADLGQLLLPPDLKTGTLKGSYNLSVTASHLIYESPAVPGKGFGIYAKAAKADGNPNPIQASFIGGFAGQGIVSGRPLDEFGIGYYFYDLSDALESSVDPVIPFDDERGLELYYKVAMAPWFQFTVDLQWIDPARQEFGDAWDLALRANIDF